MERHLDLRNIIQSQTTLAILLKRTLTKNQRLLLAWQRDVVPNFASDHDMSSSGGDDFVAQSKRDPGRVATFMKEMKKFNPETDLDRRLLLGVIMRDAHDISGKMKQASDGMDDISAEDPYTGVL